MAARAAQTRIEPYLDGQLGPSETARLEKVLLDDVVLQSLVQAQKAFRSFLQRALTAVQVPDGLEDRIRRCLGWKTIDGNVLCSLTGDVRGRS